jgi:cytochrome c peroxidase
VPWLAKADFIIQDDRFEMERQLARLDIEPVDLTNGDIDALVAFLNALTGETARTLPLGRPDRVPSGLPVD